MRYRYTIVKNDKPIQGGEVDSLEHAHQVAWEFVRERMDAFGEDRQALEDYGYLRAEDAALAIGEDGGYVYVPDGYHIEITPLKEFPEGIALPTDY